MCGETRLSHLFEYPEVQWNIFDDNTRFFKFAAGIDNASEKESTGPITS